MSFELCTDRLILRDLQPSDAPQVVKYFAEPSAQRFILSIQKRPGHIEALVNGAVQQSKQSTRRHYHLAITGRDTGTVLGVGSLINAEQDSSSALVGWHLGEAHGGKGYATETALALLHLAFEHHRVRKVDSDCFADNKGTLRVLAKIGMRAHRSMWLVRWLLALTYNEFRPVVRHCISRQEWDARMEAPPVRGDS